ncbi:hypothetical protein BN129_3589 [Cronobacter sakazakii 701]|nr:hypothetical protein BN129_3589 [Cronobacter sakazakii 701]
MLCFTCVQVNLVIVMVNNDAPAGSVTLPRPGKGRANGSAI